MKNFTKLIFAFLFTISQIFSAQAQDLVLQGIIDFTVPSGGSDGKAIHVKAINAIPDLSVYGIGVANNGGGTDGEEYSFDAISVSAGDDILVARDIAEMTAYLDACATEFEHVLLANTGISQNGDDAIELYLNGTVIETFGDIDTDGTGEAWEYMDSWAYRTGIGTVAPPSPTLISECGDFDAGPNTSWPYVLVATTTSQGSISQGAQTFTMNVTNLPSGGANVRVYKTTANGSVFLSGPTALALGSNSLTVSSVTFNRTVKFQFSSGDVEFDDLVLNGVSSACPIVPAPESLINACDEFDAGPTAWPYVLTATTASQGSISQGPQTFSMNVTSLPAGGANFRVYKTTANGNDFFGPPQAMTLGANGITVGGVSFDRTVKFQFSSGDVEFNALSLNGVATGCVGALQFFVNEWSFGGVNCTDGTTTINDASCLYPICGSVAYTLNMFDSFGDGWNGSSFDVTDYLGNLVYSETILTGSSGTATLDLGDGCYDVSCGGGSWMGEVSWNLTAPNGVIVLSGGAPYSGSMCSPFVYGCTDTNATNYDATATADDGSCLFVSCTAPAPYNQEFSTGLLPVGVCAPNQWATSVTTGDGWRFTGNPGYQAGANGRTAGTYTWVDFSGTDVGTILEVEDVDVSTLTNPTLFIDYFSDIGTYTLSGTGLPNALHIEGYDGTSWVAIDTLQLLASGWNSYNFALTGALNGTTAEIRFRAESGGAGNDFYNDLLLDDVKITSLISGCTDSTFSNFDPLATVDDGSCANSYTLYMFDSFGDGWNGNTWTATGLTSGTVYGPFTILSGSADSASFTSADDCFSVVCNGGFWQTEVSWDLHLSGSSVLTGGAPYTGSFGNNCISGCTDPAACNYDPSAHFDDGSCSLGDYYTVNLYDSFGDGWNGNTLTLTDQSGTLFFTTTLATGTVGVDSFCTDILSACYDVVCGGGSWQGEVSWEIVDPSGTILLTGGAPYTGNFGTCVPGCTDPSALNYDASATVDDGGCIPCGDTYYINMYDSFGDGWNGNTFVVTDTSGNQILNTTLASGSTGIDSLCANLPLYCYGITCGGGLWAGEVSWEIVDSAGTILLTGGAPYTGTFGTCVYGCTDPTAFNYDATATVDDGSCSSCNTMTLIMNDSFGDGWNGNRWQLVDLSGNIFYDTTLTSGSTDTLSVCVLAGNCYEVVVDYGAWQGEVSWSLLDGAGTTVLSGGAPYSGNYVGDGCVYGCMQPFADNYNALANLDDGSCSYASCLAADSSESFESFGVSYTGDLNLWIQETSDDLNWTVLSGSTPSFNTGPDAAYDGTNYIYIESSSPAFAGQTASIYTPCVDLSAWNNPSLVFAYHMWGFTMGTLSLEVSADGGATWDSVWAMTGQQGSFPQWNFTGIDLAAYSGSTVAVKFTGTVGTSFTSDMALDAISFEELPVFACMDPNASNYDPTATTDDGSCTYATTFNVDMGCQVPGSFTSVSVESPDLSCYGGCITLSDPDGDDVWSVTLDLTPGNYVYLYAIDNNSSQENLVDDMLNGASCAPYTDFFSYANREIIVGTTSSSSDDTYGSCDPCIRGCTDPAANNYDSLAIVENGTCEYNVTFVVDMNCSGLTPTTVAATGPADNWSGNTYLLSDADGDGVWEGTYSVTDNFVYLYVVDSWANSEFNGLFNEMLNGTNSCAPYTDGLSYAYRLAASPSTTSDTYGQCTACPPGCTDPAASNFDANAQIDDGSCLYAATFNVDMNCEPAGSFGYVHLESPVFGWCGGCVPLSDPDGDGVHSVTVDLPLGNFEYKYAVDGWAGQENLIDDMQNGASCAPVTDYYSYANRLVSIVAGLSTSDTYGSCDTCDQVNGCTDPGAVNYDALATEDDGSCLFSTTFNVDMNCEPAGSFGYVHLESPSFGWCGGCVPMTDPDGDGVHSVTVDLPAGNFEYKYAVDGWAGQENLIDDMQNGASCAPVTDYFSYANRLIDVNGLVFTDNIVVNGDFTNGTYGWNLNSNWTELGGALTALGSSSNDFNSNTTIQGPIVAGTTYEVSYEIVSNVSQGGFQASLGATLGQENSSMGVHVELITATSNDRFRLYARNLAVGSVDNIVIREVLDIVDGSSDTYGSCDECIAGCMDSLAFNYNDSAIVDDGSCLYGYNCPAPYPIGLSSSDIYAEMATIHWDDANSGSCRVWKYFVRYRPVGDSVWTTKAAGVGSGLCNVGLPNTSKVLRNLMPSTTYEFKMKAFYCGGGESGYSYTDQFTTLAACPPMTNLAVQTFSSNHGKAKFTWDETGPYTFARIALRVNTPGSSWQTAGGFGINYPTFMVMKFGLTGGTEYRAQGRTFCDPVVTSYRSTWTAPIVWTQPGVAPIRLDGGNAINNLEVYPNPSKDIFNVSFVSEDIQNLEVRVLNLIGEVIYTEGLEQFVGEYTKSISMSSYTKGVYFLEITTNDGVVNKKIVLQ